MCYYLFIVFQSLYFWQWFWYIVLFYLKNKGAREKDKWADLRLLVYLVGKNLACIEREKWEMWVLMTHRPSELLNTYWGSSVDMHVTGSLLALGSADQKAHDTSFVKHRLCRSRSVVHKNCRAGGTLPCPLLSVRQRFLWGRVLSVSTMFHQFHYCAPSAP